MFVITSIAEQRTSEFDSIDKDRKRMSLSMATADSQEDGSGKTIHEARDDFREYVNKAPASLGSLGDILKGKFGKKK